MNLRHRWLLLPVAFIMGCSVASAGFFNRPNSPVSGAAPRIAELKQEEKQEQVESAKQESEPVDRTRLLSPADANETAPDQFQVKVETSRGDFVIEVNRDWAPQGADRFYNLVKIGYFNDIAIFRAIDGFMFQFGIHGDPEVNKAWMKAKIKDDPDAGKSNQPGTITFATSGPDSRTVQLFVNLENNDRLDEMGFRPFGKVVEGAAVLGKINTEYGENSREVQGRFQSEGNEYIKKRYPNLDYIKSITVIEK